MTPTEAAKLLHMLDWSDQAIANRVVSSQPVINRIRRGERNAPYHLGNAIVKLAKKEQRKREKAA